MHHLRLFQFAPGGRSSACYGASGGRRPQLAWFRSHNAGDDTVNIGGSRAGRSRVRGSVHQCPAVRHPTIGLLPGLVVHYCAGLEHIVAFADEAVPAAYLERANKGDRGCNYQWHSNSGMAYRHCKIWVVAAAAYGQIVTAFFVGAYIVWVQETLKSKSAQPSRRSRS